MIEIFSQEISQDFKVELLNFSNIWSLRWIKSQKYQMAKEFFHLVLFYHSSSTIAAIMLPSPNFFIWHFVKIMCIQLCILIKFSCQNMVKNKKRIFRLQIRVKLLWSFNLLWHMNFETNLYKQRCSIFGIKYILFALWLDDGG